MGVEDWKELDKTISPNPHDFLEMMKNFFLNWNRIQMKNDICIIIIGDIPITHSSKTVFLHEAVYDIAKSNYRLKKAYKDSIPEEKKMVKGNDKIKREIILVLEKN